MMATSADFYGNEPVPHLYPPPRPMVRGADILATSYSFQPIRENRVTFHNHRKDDLEISQILDDEDSLPLTEQISLFKNWKSTARPELCAPDPDLGLTPEKQLPSHRSNLKANVNILPDVKGKAGLKVRFDVESSSESEIDRSPEKFNDSVEIVDVGETDVSIHDLLGQMTIQKHYAPIVCIAKTDAKSSNEEVTMVTDHTKVYPYSIRSASSLSKHPLKTSQLDDIETILTSENRCPGVGSKNKNIHGAIPKISTKGNNCSSLSDEDCKTGDKAGNYFKHSVVTREREERPVIAEYSFPFTEDSEPIEEMGILIGSTFERPEYNSTLQVGKELNSLKANKLNLAKALKKKLENSENIRTEINEKAAVKVNARQEVYKGLVSLEVPVEDIVTQVERDQVSKSRSANIKHKRAAKSKDLTGKEPDIMDLFTPDLQRETADFSLPGMSMLKETLSSAAHERAFDLYRHNRAWESLD